jgi:hypothetical protein
MRWAALAAGLWTSGMAWAGEAGRLPVDWFVAPEDEAAFERSPNARDEDSHDGSSYSRGEDKAARSLDDLFESTAKALDETGDVIGSRDRPADAPDDWVPWHLREMYLDLGVNLAGTAGLITGIGDATVELRWRQSEDRMRRMGLVPAAGPSPEKAGEAGAQPADVVLDETMSYEELERQIDAVSDAVMATGRVNDRPRMRAGLMKVARDVQALMIDVNTYNDSHWDANRFGLDIDISGSGQVSAGWTVGGAVRLRFEWARANYGAPLPEPMDGRYEEREALRKLIAGLAQDMDTVGDDLYRGSGFDLTTMKLGIGLYLSAKFGVVKGKGAVTGFVFFNKTARKANANYGDRPRIVPDAEIPLIDDEPQPAHLAYAQEHGVRYDRVPGADDPASERLVYYMTREKWQKGLQRATKMGAFFAERAARKTGEQAEHSRWRIDQVKPNFALSLEGNATVVTIGGKVSLELTFRR